VEGEDLGAVFSRITRRLLDAERPLLAAHGLSMWGYVVLSRLLLGESNTQLDLADAVGYDKTRLISLLDELEGQGLLTRHRDPSDRRARIVRLTAAGRARHAAARADIRSMEDSLLAPLPAAERRSLRAALDRLASQS
jgi:DNA-binding MarR family transcriptional regulator